MRLSAAKVFADAIGMWRGAREALVPVAGVFFFLPALATMLFVPTLNLEGLEGEAIRVAITDYAVANFPWFAAQVAVESVGVGALLVLLLDPARLSVGEALARAFRLLPGLFATRMIVAIGATIGFWLMILPGLYVMTRSFLTSAHYIAEPKRGPVGAVISGFALTRGNGLTLFALLFTSWTISSLLGGGILLQVAVSAEPMGWFVAGPLKAVSAAVVAGGMLLAVLFEAAAYRALPAPSTGT